MEGKYSFMHVNNIYTYLSKPKKKYQRTYAKKKLVYCSKPNKFLKTLVISRS